MLRVAANKDKEGSKWTDKEHPDAKGHYNIHHLDTKATSAT